MEVVFDWCLKAVDKIGWEKCMISVLIWRLDAHITWFRQHLSEAVAAQRAAKKDDP